MDRENRTLLESYHSRVHDFKQRAETTLPHGEPVLFAGFAFITSTCLLLFALNIISIVAPTASLPLWIQAVPYVIGAFAGYTGWKYANL